MSSQCSSGWSQNCSLSHSFRLGPALKRGAPVSSGRPAGPPAGGAAHPGKGQPSVCPLLAAPRTAARQAPLSTERCRQEYWRGLPLPSPGDFSDPGTEPTSQHCRQFLYCLSHQGSPSHREGALQLNSISFPRLQKLPEPERHRKSPRIKLACAQHQTRQEYNV